MLGMSRMKIEKKTTPMTLKKVSFARLSFQALPEIWTYQLLAGLLMIIPVSALRRAAVWIAGVGGEAVTTANLRQFLLSWRFPVVLFLGILLVIIYFVFELVAQIYLTDCILTGRRLSTFGCVKAGFASVRRFMNPDGIGILAFILFGVPVCGVGLSLSIARSYIPNFIMAAMMNQPVLAVLFMVLIVFLVWTAYRWIFVLHGVLLDGMTPKEAKKQSSRIVKVNRVDFLRELILTGLVTLVIWAGSGMLLRQLPGLLAGKMGEGLPAKEWIDAASMIRDGAEFSGTQLQVIGYRILAVFAVLMEKYLSSIVMLLCGAYFMLRLNRWYMEYTIGENKVWPERPRKSRYIWKVILILLVFIFFAFASVLLGIEFERVFFREEPVKIVAHRAGGSMASENSLEGIKKAIGQGCYASEIDIQRTKDGHYIINHDNDFKRLAGVDKASQDMTLEEIRKLRIKDTTGSGQEVPVAEFEEMLDVCKGRIKLYVELKGKTADRQMVDDAVRIIREHDCVEDTALISLKYDLIKYAETTYPEFETGTLFFASLGDVSSLKCDLLIMEEGNADEENIRMIHDAQKTAVVWTVNSEENMHDFLDSEVDAIITDEVVMAREVQARLDDRTILELLEDKITI